MVDIINKKLQKLMPILTPFCVVIGILFHFIGEQLLFVVPSTADARRYIEDGQFAPGSMLPKIEACLDFVASGAHRTALITSLDRLDDALAGKVGTLIK